MEQLLKTTGLENRWIDRLSQPEEPISWAAVEERLQTARKDSFRFLREALQFPPDATIPPEHSSLGNR